MRHQILTSALALLATCGACTTTRGETPPPAAADPGLEVFVDPPRRALVLSNGGTDRLYYTVFERRFATRANWAVCSDPARCRSVAPGERTRVAFDSISGYHDDSRDLIVFWWKLVAAAQGTLRPDSVRSRIVPIAPGSP